MNARKRELMKDTASPARGAMPAAIDADMRFTAAMPARESAVPAAPKHRLAGPFGKPPPRPKPRKRRKRAPITPEQTRKLLERHQRDWFRILSDLQALGLKNADVARALRLRDSTIRNWKYGKEPTHARGEALLALHARLTRRSGRPSKRELK